MNKKAYTIILIILVALVVLCSFLLPDTSSKYSETINQGVVVNIYKPKYYIRFNANTGAGSMETQEFVYDEYKTLSPNAFTKSGYQFEKWTTEIDGTGLSYQDKEEVGELSQVDGTYVDLYAQWKSGVARIGGKVYPTLQDAVNDVPTTGAETVVELLESVSENVTVAAGKNITFDFNNYTVSTTRDPAITNAGIVRIMNGTVTTSANNTAAINNTGTMYISGGTVSMTNENGKQAIYNDGGTLEISGNAYISSVSGKNNNNKRPTVHNLKNGTLRITGGTIVSTKNIAVRNETGSLTIGFKDGNPNATSPIIQGATYGIQADQPMSFYNGTIKGKTAAVDNESRITDMESGFLIFHEDETIGSDTYHTIYLGMNGKLVIFDPNGGTCTELSRGVNAGDPVGALPTPTWSAHIFDGWFDAPTGGNSVSDSTIINDDITFYAHWTEFGSVVMNGVRYESVQDAISAAPVNTRTVITLLEDVVTNEKIEIAANKNIVFDFQNHSTTITGHNVCLENKGTLEIISGTVTSAQGTDQGTINTYNGATLKISGGNVTNSTGRQALYIYSGGYVEISGNSYLSSNAAGVPRDTSVDRGTVQNLTGGTLVITGGTIVAEVQQAISNEGTMIVGTSDGSISNSSPCFIGETYGIYNAGSFEYYDGVAKGITDAIYGTINVQESNTQVVDTTEVIDGKTYQVEYLKNV